MSENDICNLMDYFELICLKKLIENIAPEKQKLMNKSNYSLALPSSTTNTGFGLRASLTAGDAPLPGFGDLIGSLKFKSFLNLQ